ncbi:1,4-alpha-glucan branching protein GlgB [Ferrimonas sp. YFM]|uniref:1,4-alpha-glucan branching protein GlgB n=1 Tax=Ferrimonas sp. YFM TaxID=3028878 RepID=UPI00257309D2|nr:1,4-alpha-glucan branching protein GlgB [Ferrimonas sp. YFM]BDY05894.1 1,4-alpha-glucan branching enzyme GlgB [Ferrimonas sp. YFM]
MTQVAAPLAPLAPHQLGMQMTGDTLMVGCRFPGAIAVTLLSLSPKRKVASLPQWGSQGDFYGPIPRRRRPFRYLLKVEYEQHSVEVIDPYQFPSLLEPRQRYLFAEGSEERAWHFLGANPREIEGIAGVHFCLWAPNARQVCLMGDFNHWDRHSHPMRHQGDSGLWELFIPALAAGEHYKFHIQGSDGHWRSKADPFAREMELPPHNASRIPSHDEYQWQDQEWMAQRRRRNSYQAPLSIYELHAGSWRRAPGNRPLTYRELARDLVPYVKEMGFTHIQLMPLASHPFEGSWGYQPIGLFAPDARLGSPEDLKALVDACHQAGIGVLLDWVAAHFPSDPHGLNRLDGTALYEHEDPRLGLHPDWDTQLFNYGRHEVVSYLLSNAFYWLEQFHFDGLRLDAVSSMLYLDYSREEGQWLPNAEGGRENLEAAAFLRTLNQRLHFNFPGVQVIAEESTTWPGITRPVDAGGLGFGYKWNMGWMNDTLRYLQQDPIHRRHHHGLMNFAMLYAYSEHFILSLSHDEVVHGKGSLLNKIPGDLWQKFATLKAYLGFMWTHPGKKLLFMGGEFGQWNEWNHQQSLDWHLLEYPSHQGVQSWVQALNRLYRDNPALHQLDHQPQGFSWLECNDADNSVFSYLRQDEQGRHLLVVVNMTPVPRQHFQLGVPSEGRYLELLNSDAEEFDGSGVVNGQPLVTRPEPLHGQPCRVSLTLAPLATLVLAQEECQ